MLDQQIEQAKALRITRLRNGAIVVGFLVLLAVVAVTVSQFIGSNTQSDSSLSENTEPKSTGPKSTELKSTVAETTANAVVPDTIDTDAERKTFQQQLVAFEEQYTSLLENPDFLNWNKAGAESITTSKDEALALFASGHYSQAITVIDHAAKESARLDKAWLNAYEEKLLQAQDAYDREDVNNAQLALNQAMAIKPKEPRTKTLQEQLDAYPRIAQWLQQLKVAKAENNVAKQVTILSDIVAADKTRLALAEELKRLQKQLNDARFSQHIAQGLDAVDKQQLEKALASYHQAKRIYSQRAELKSLQSKISQARKAARLETVLSQIKQSIQQDDWSTVASITQSVNDPAVQSYRDDASHILKLQRRADVYLSQPRRLLDSDIRQQAQTFIRENIKSTLKSPSLAEQMNRLSELLESAQVKQTLHIVSNGKTDIWVLGVGHVGEVTEKEVALLPGEYTLEGRCKGYRHKQVQVSLFERQSVKLVCDERIR